MALVGFVDPFCGSGSLELDSMIVNSLPGEWRDIIRQWASTLPLITGIWLYGSRVKGGAREDSDLDVAFTCVGDRNESALTTVIFNRQKWEAALQALLPVKVHLQYADPDEDEVVWPAVQDHGIRIA